MKLNNPEGLRRQVREHYARAVGGDRTSATAIGLDALGYSEDETKDLPETATQATFGCGNPLAFSSVQPGQTVLDLGSGAGMDLLLAVKRVGPAGKVIGIDMTDAMLEKARANIARSGFRNIELRKGYIEALPVEDGSIDWIISNCVINLSPEKDKVFAGIFRALKPGGTMLVSDLVAEDLPSWIRSLVSLYSPCVGRAISERQYVQGLERAGLRNVGVVEKGVYDKEFIARLITEDLPKDSLGRLVPRFALKPVANWFATRIGGKVASVRVSAVKPA